MTTAAAMPSFVRRSRVILACVAVLATLAAVVEVPHGSAPAPQAQTASFA